MRSVKHPSRSAYVLGCGCVDCWQENADYMADYRRLRRRLGLDPRRSVPVESVRALVWWLHDAGGNDVWIAERTGISRKQVWMIRHSRVDWCQLRTRDVVESLARRVAAGEVHPPGYADARRRQLDRERRRQYREAS